jgi:RND family efflux transporter MFP subunit
MKTTISGALLAVLICSSVQLLAQEPISVSVVTPQPAGDSERLRLSGSVVAPRRASLSVATDGLVVQRAVDIGNRVAQGQLLLELDATLAQTDLAHATAALHEATANRDEARRQLDEAQRLRADKHVSENEVLSRQALLAVSEAQVEAAQARQRSAQEVIRRHSLRAPFTGVISSRSTDVGEWVSRGDAVFELVGLDELYVDVSVPQEHFDRIDETAPVEVCTDNRPVRCSEGRIAAQVPVVSSATRSFQLRVGVDSDELALLPGASATVVLSVGGSVQALRVPSGVLIRHPDGGYSVFVVQDGRAQRRRVSVVQDRSGEALISEGLTLSDRVVLRGKSALTENQPVSID